MPSVEKPIAPCKTSLTKWICKDNDEIAATVGSRYSVTFVAAGASARYPKADRRHQLTQAAADRHEERPGELVGSAADLVAVTELDRRTFAGFRMVCVKADADGAAQRGQKSQSGQAARTSIAAARRHQQADDAQEGRADHQQQAARFPGLEIVPVDVDRVVILDIFEDAFEAVLARDRLVSAVGQLAAGTVPPQASIVGRFRVDAENVDLDGGASVMRPMVGGDGDGDGYGSDEKDDEADHLQARIAGHVDDDYCV